MRNFTCRSTFVVRMYVFMGSEKCLPFCMSMTHLTALISILYVKTSFLCQSIIISAMYIAIVLKLVLPASQAPQCVHYYDGRVRSTGGGGGGGVSISP